VRPHRWQPTRLPHPWDSPGKNTGVGCHFLLQCMKVKSEVAQSCPTPSDPMDCSLPGSSIHGVFQARVLEWVAIAFSAGILHQRSKVQLVAVDSMQTNTYIHTYIKINTKRDTYIHTYIKINTKRVLKKKSPHHTRKELELILLCHKELFLEQLLSAELFAGQVGKTGMRGRRALHPEEV